MEHMLLTLYSEVKMIGFNLVFSKVLSSSENSMTTKGINFIVADVCVHGHVCMCMHICLCVYNSVFFLARKRVLTTIY